MFMKKHQFLVKMKLGNINKLIEINFGLFFIRCILAILLMKIVSAKNGEEMLITVMNNVTELCENETLELCTTIDNSVSTEITAAGNNTTVITTELNSANTTVSPTTSKSPMFHTHYVPEKDCHCDMTKQICDVNCCCDRDCSDEDRTVFSYCNVAYKPVDPRYCFSQKFIYRNNTQYIVTVEQSGLFCILIDNTVKTTEYTNLPVVTSLDEVRKLTNRTEHFSWSSYAMVHTMFDRNAEYKAGSVIWTVCDHHIVPFVLTGPAANSLCKGNLRVSYLQSFESVCNKFIPVTKEDCRDLTVVPPILISSPKLYNFTKIEECSEDVCLVTQQFVCGTHNNSCVETNLTEPVFNNEDRSCLNVVYSAHYVIHHCGVQGIYQVKGYFNLMNISAVEHREYFRYANKVTFEWLDKSYKNNTFKRSGHPGYLIRMPLISSHHVSKADKDGIDKEIVEVSADEKDWISIGVAGDRGECGASLRQNIMFGINRQTRCTINVTGDCNEIQKTIWHQLFGENVNVTEDSVNLYVSSYGDPHTDVLDDWVPILLSSHNPSDSIMSSFNVQILYTYVESVTNPQAKIIGMFVESTRSGNLKCQSPVTNVSLSVVTFVSFIDITEPAITKFARPPVYEIKLPEDFFYPFLSEGVCLSVGINCLILVILINLTVSYY